MARFRWMFSISTVASSTRMPTANARPPRVIMLMVWPLKCKASTEKQIESGIDVATTSVLRHDPRKSKIIRAVNEAAMVPSRKTPFNAELTNTD